MLSKIFLHRQQTSKASSAAESMEESSGSEFEYESPSRLPTREKAAIRTTKTTKRQSGSGQSGSGQSGSAKLGGGQSGGAKLGSGQSGGAKLGSGQSGGAKLGSGQSGGAKLHSGQSESAKLGSVQPGSAKLGSGKRVQPGNDESEQLCSGGEPYRCLMRGCPSETNAFIGPRNYANHLK